MKLVPSKVFIRDSRRFLKRNPQFIESLKATLKLLESDVFNPQLKTHNIKGQIEKLLGVQR